MLWKKKNQWHRIYRINKVIYTSSIEFSINGEPIAMPNINKIEGA